MAVVNDGGTGENLWETFERNHPTPLANLSPAHPEPLGITANDPFQAGEKGLAENIGDDKKDSDSPNDHPRAIT